MSQVKSGCLISLGKKDFGCSGIVIHNPHGYVLSHASFLLPFFDQNKNKWRKLKEQNSLHGIEFKDTKVDILFESVSKSRISTQATVICVWKNKTFEHSVRSLFPPRDKWTFSGKASDQDPTEELLAELIPFFVLLQVKHAITCKVHKFLPSTKLNIQDTVYAIGTPYGNLSPPVFMNSVSKGIVCNKSGRDDCVVLTDARCIPGCEGGALYTEQDERCIVGLVVAPLCWKENEWVGYTIVCGIQSVMESLAAVSKQHRIGLSTGNVRHQAHSQRDQGIAFSASDIEPQVQSVEMDMGRIVRVESFTDWGTGLLVDAKRGLVLSCGHVVKDRKHVDVRIIFPSGVRWFGAKVLKAVPNTRAFDISVLQLEEWEEQESSFKTFRIAENIWEGNPISMAGYGVFGREHNLQPTVTRGVIAKTIAMDGRMVMLQATCAVHGGASGGPLVADDGSFVGLVTCNAKDTKSGIVYPHVNLSVPLSTIWPVLQRYIHSNDVRDLDALQIHNPTVQKLWQLQLKEIPEVATLPSKL